MPRAVARKRRHMREGQAAGGLRGACFAAPIQPGRAMDGGIRLARWLMPKRRAAARAYAPARFRHPAARILNWQVPRGLGSSAAALLLLASVCYGVVRGGHVAEIAAQVQDLCDEAANAAGFGITEVALDRRARSQPRATFSRSPASPATPRCCSSMPATARARLLTNPWIADATVLKLYPEPAAHRDQGAHSPSRSGRRTAASR